MKTLIAALACLASFSASAHGGGLDANGGHYNRKTGEYHCHRCATTPPKKDEKKREQPKQPKSDEKKKAEPNGGSFGL